MLLPALELICPACSLQGHLIRGGWEAREGTSRVAKGGPCALLCSRMLSELFGWGLKLGSGGTSSVGGVCSQGPVSGFHLYCGGSDVIIT